MASTVTRAAVCTTRSTSRATAVEQVLAVVEHEQELLRAQEVEQGLVERLTHTGLHAERGGERFDDRVRLTDGRELAEPRAVVVAREDVGGDLGREPGLAHAAHAGEGHDPRVVERARDVCQLALASDETGGLERQVARERIERSQRREVVFKIVVTDLQHVFGSLEVTEAMLTEIEERDVDERVARELGSGV